MKLFPELKRYSQPGHDPGYMYKYAAGIDATVMQIIPCSILAVMTIIIIYKIKESKEQRAILRNKDQASPDDQTSTTLLAIVILFLICELPIAILLSLSLFNHDIYVNIVLKTYHLAHLMRLLNASLNFILYCSTSSLFRSTFVEVFYPYVPKIIMSIVSPINMSDRTPDGSKSTDSIELS